MVPFFCVGAGHFDRTSSIGISGQLIIPVSSGNFTCARKSSGTHHVHSFIECGIGPFSVQFDALLVVTALPVVTLIVVTAGVEVVVGGTAVVAIRTAAVDDNFVVVVSVAGAVEAAVCATIVAMVVLPAPAEPTGDVVTDSVGDVVDALVVGADVEGDGVVGWMLVGSVAVVIVVATGVVVGGLVVEAIVV